MRRRQVSRTQTTSLARRFAPVTSKKYFIPSLIPGCQLWLDGSDSSSIIKTGTNVTAWKDKSGNGYHMDTITPNAGWSGTATYPTIGTSINGLQTVNFTAQAGLKQSLTLDGVKNLFWIGRIAAPTGTAAGGASIYFLLGHDNNYDWHGSYYGQRFIDGTNAQGGVYGATASLFTSDANAVTNATFGLMNLPSAPSISLLSVTGITGTTRYQGICYDRSTHTGWCGDLAEVITFTTALTTAQRQAVEGYLAHKWGLTKYYSPVTPLTIPGCSIWLDASDTSSLTLSGSTVTTWKDKSGNGNNFSSVIGSTTVTTDNGKNVVSFTSTSAVMSSVNNVPLTSSSAIFVVSKLLGINASTFGYILALPDILGWDDYSFRYRSGDALIGTRAFPGGDDGNIGNANYYVNGEFDPITTGQFLNKYSVISTIKPTRTGTTKVLLSSSSSGRYFNGYIAEFIYYSGGVTLSQRETIENYLMKKWGLTGLLPSTHPYVNFIPAPPSLFIPPLIAEGCVLWLDGADTGSMTLSGSSVTQWIDKSGRGFNVATSSGATAPLYNSTTKELQFVSGNSNSFTIPQGFGDALVGKTFSFFFIGKRTVNTTYVYFLSGATSGGNQTLFIGFFSNKMEIGEYGPYASADIPTFNSPDPMRLYYYDIQTSTSANLVMNGNLLPTTVSGNLFLTSFAQPELGRRYGGAVYHDFNLSEMVVFSPALTTSQRTQVEGYLAHKWGLNTSLPSTHLYKSLNPSDLVSTNNFLPTMVSGCGLWLDGADTSSISMSLTGSTLNTWKDKSGNGYNFTRAYSSSPTISNLGTGTAPYFDANQALYNTTIPFPKTYTIFSVANLTGLPPYHCYIMHAPYNADHIIFFGAYVRDFATFAGPVGSWNDVNANSPTSTIASTSTTASLLCCTNDGTTLRPYFNGTTLNTKVGTNASATGMFIGDTYLPGQHWRGAIAEFIVYNKVLTTTERQQVESYLAWKWSLQTSLPSDHTYKIAPPSV
jgi:hypothetical protein